MSIVTQEDFDLLNRLYLEEKHKFENKCNDYNILDLEYKKLFENFEYIASIVEEIEKEKENKLEDLTQSLILDDKN